jgi:hypothetical protein
MILAVRWINGWRIHIYFYFQDRAPSITIWEGVFWKGTCFYNLDEKLDSLVYEMTGQSVLDRLYSPELKEQTNLTVFNLHILPYLWWSIHWHRA